MTGVLPLLLFLPISLPSHILDLHRESSRMKKNILNMSGFGIFNLYDISRAKERRYQGWMQKNAVVRFCTT